MESFFILHLHHKTNMMNTAHTTKITIPKPCHENWNQMTPNEKGAFCQKCCKTVVDFTSKTTEEIITALTTKKQEKVCGRFNNNQISSPPIQLQIPRNLLPKNIPMHKAFVIALFISFGSTLFSCSTHKGQTMGDVAIIDSAEITNQSTVKQLESQHLLGDTILVIETPDSTTIEPKMGEIRIIPPAIPEEKQIKMGKVKIEK